MNLLIFLLILLLILHFLRMPYVTNTVFYINGHQITFYHIVALAILIWLLTIIPIPVFFTQILGIILILWLLSIIGIGFIGGDLLFLILLIILLYAIF